MAEPANRYRRFVTIVSERHDYSYDVTFERLNAQTNRAILVLNNGLSGLPNLAERLAQKFGVPVYEIYSFPSYRLPVGTSVAALHQVIESAHIRGMHVVCQGEAIETALALAASRPGLVDTITNVYREKAPHESDICVPIPVMDPAPRLVRVPLGVEFKPLGGPRWNAFVPGTDDLVQAVADNVNHRPNSGEIRLPLRRAPSGNQLVLAS